MATGDLELQSVGVAAIGAERRRQVEVEGWAPEHDDEHTNGEMAIAAACYAWNAPRPLEIEDAWPWDRRWWKPTTPEVTIVPCRCRSVSECNHCAIAPDALTRARMRDLAKAGALIAAEIDRLDRALRANQGGAAT